MKLGYETTVVSYPNVIGQRLIKTTRTLNGRSHIYIGVRGGSPNGVFFSCVRWRGVGRWPGVRPSVRPCVRASAPAARQILLWYYVFQQFRWPTDSCVDFLIRGATFGVLTALARLCVVEMIASETPE